MESGLDVRQPNFGAGNNQSRVGDHIAAGPKAVAIERRAEQPAIGEDQRRGPVPGLHAIRVIAVERVSSFPTAAGGRSMRTASATLRSWLPSNSATSSRLIESEASRVRSGSHSRGSVALRASMCARLPQMVLISPLCAIHAQRLRAMP